MDWKVIADQFDPMTCVLSVEKSEDGGYGAIRIVTGNQSYIDSIAIAAGGVELEHAQKKEFIPNSLYTRYIPKDLNFEDICYRCAVLKQPMRNFVHMPRYPFDINAFLMPMKYEDETCAYCTYSQVLIPKTEENLLTKNISLDTAMDVISTGVKLRGNKLFHDNVSEVAEDIRIMCGAEHCCVLLMDERNRSCSVLGEAKSPESGLPWIKKIINDDFYDIAETWLDTIGGSYCLAVTDQREMNYLRERDPELYRFMVDREIRSFVLFPLYSQDNLIGYIWLADFDPGQINRIRETLELTAIYIAAEISSKYFEEKPLAGKSATSTEASAEKGGLSDDRLQKVDHIISGLSEEMNQHLNVLNNRADSMITAMASDYRSVYYINLDENDGVCYRDDPDDQYQSPQGVHFPYLERFTYYAENFVDDGYREEFLNFIDPDHIRKSLAEQPIIAYRYLARRDGKEYYEMIRMAGVRRASDREDGKIHAIGLGFTEIDAEVRENMAKNEALAEALHVAEEASRAKTAFLSNMSHEIRTPMNAIIGLNRLTLREEGLSSETRENLLKIGKTADHLLSLINDILDMSRIESGHQVLRNEEFSLGSMLEQINLMVMSQCSDKGLTFENRMLNHVDDYYIGDATKLKEVLLNILSNAIKFTAAPGTVSMTVEQTARYGDQTTLRFCIRDTGIGMEKEYLAKIFEPFSQEDSSRKNKFGSTGLGMAITKGLVEMMNGSIHVESEKGVGTEFTVMVTLRNSEKETETIREEQPDTAGASDSNPENFPGRTQSPDQKKETVSLEGRRVLLAEDIEINAEIMMDLLSIEDIEADHAVNGREALELFEKQPAGTYSAVLMDVRMPEMDGLEAAQAIRALKREDAKRIPIIALTANAFDEDVQRSLQAGMNSHLSKPVDSDRLFQVMGELIYEAERSD